MGEKTQQDLLQPILKERKLNPNNTSKEETTLSRLRIEHARLTHSFILKDEPPPKMPLWKSMRFKTHLD